MSSTAVDTGPRTGAPALRPRPWRPRHVGRWIVLGLVLVVAVGMWIRHRVEQDHLRQPLEVVQRASVQAHKPIAVLSPSIAERWTSDNGTPSEDRVRPLSQPGNAFLEPVFYFFFGRHGEPGAEAAPAHNRCYYFPVQRGSEFDPARVSAIARLCYLGSGQTAYEAAWTAVR